MLKLKVKKLGLPGRIFKALKKISRIEADP